MSHETATGKDKSIVSYEQHQRCPLCGSDHYTVGAEHRELLQPAALPADKMYLQANVSFTSALCESCGVSFNIKGLSNATRITLAEKNYAFIKPSTGVGASNYTPYIDLICKYLKDKDMSYAEIGGYDGYTPQVLSERGYTDLTLIDPSPNVDETLIAKGKLKLYQGFFPHIDPVWELKDKAYEQRESHLYDMITAKDVLQMLSNPQDLVNAANICLKKGGIAIFSSGPLNVMHPQQNLHIGLNAYRHMARCGGFSIVESLQPIKDSSIYYVLRKEVDLVSGDELTRNFVTSAPCSSEDFEAEQKIQRENIKSHLQTPPEGLAKLNEAVSRHHVQGHEIIFFGSGHLCSEFMANLELPLSSIKLTIVNSSPEEDGFVYLKPDNTTAVVHYAGKYLKDKHVPLIVLAVRSRRFKDEIEQLLKSINCICDELVYVFD